MRDSMEGSLPDWFLAECSDMLSVAVGVRLSCDRGGLTSSNRTDGGGSSAVILLLYAAITSTNHVYWVQITSS